MDSINRDQPEDNHRDVQGHEAVERIKGVVDKTDTCFFFTGVATATRQRRDRWPCTKVDDQGSLWFMSASDSHKNQDWTGLDSVLVLSGVGTFRLPAPARHGFRFTRPAEDRRTVGPGHEDLVHSKARTIRASPSSKVVPIEGYYWDNKHGNFVAGIKMMIGAATGKTFDDSIEGRVKP